MMKRGQDAPFYPPFFSLGKVAKCLAAVGGMLKGANEGQESPAGKLKRGLKGKNPNGTTCVKMRRVQYKYQNSNCGMSD